MVALTSTNKQFDCLVKRYKHSSEIAACEMTFTVILPPNASESNPVPVLYWLSGLTCTDLNFIEKAGAAQYAAKHNIAIVCPDTSPRGLGYAGESDHWDFGVGAGFYLDATKAPWSTGYRMYSYITQELPATLAAHVKEVNTKNASISGHSMGGHGALSIALKNPSQYKSVSAFAPICNPTNCPWGIKAFTNYLGDNEEEKKGWANYDSTSLLQTFAEHCKNSNTDLDSLHILIDQGDVDNFLADGQLRPEAFLAKAKELGIPVAYHSRPGYNHSYFYISSFIGEHVAHHAKFLHA